MIAARRPAALVHQTIILSMSVRPSSGIWRSGLRRFAIRSSFRQTLLRRNTVE
jgi:hypothetical protein